MSDHYYNTHTLYIITHASNDGVVEAVRRIIISSTKKLDDEISSENSIKPASLQSEIVSNIVFDLSGNHLGFGYLWVSNPNLYHILLGKNPDGSDRYQYKSPHEFTTSWFHPNGDKKSWCDISDEEEEWLEKTKVALPPLFPPPSIQISKARQKEIQSRYKDPIEVPNKCEIQFQKAWTTRLDNRYTPNVLCARGIPPSVGISYFSKLVSPLCSSVNEFYPKIHVWEGSVVIIFDPKTKDAQFVLLMIKKHNIKVGKNTHVVYFGHPLRRDHIGH